MLTPFDTAKAVVSPCMYSGRIPIREFSEQFFTFLIPIFKLHGQNQTMKWQLDNQLKHHFQTLQQQSPRIEQARQVGNAVAIVEELLQIYLQDATPAKERAISQWHLAAYLEAPAYQAALDRFRAYKDYIAPSKTWEHYLHIAKCLALDPDKVTEIYHRFNPEKNRLEQHFRLELASKIRDIFYRETGQGKYSLWSALKRVSERKLKYRLSMSGIEAVKLSAYIAVRDALFEVYSKSGDRWLEPSAEQYRQAKNYFNQHYTHHQTLTLETFQLMLIICIKVNQDSVSIESLDDAITQADLSTENPLLQLEQEQSEQDYKVRLTQLDRMIAAQILQLEDKDQKILQFHAQGKNQTQIASILGINQGTVSRRYQRSQRELLSEIAQWIQTQYKISLALTEHLAQYIELWLIRQYHDENDLSLHNLKHLSPISK
jgi:DNA-directed RNA polymerase specialized sigma24 family protein